ncbi:hypothetical protein EI94DRAFT_1606282 [Lactarius quietus]|nr:hypothetical protein EI94DRAFT_1606282 [Lactarius quietus]
MEFIEEQNREIIERWKEEVDCALVFAGLFSAIGAVSLAEIYERFPQNPSNEAVKLIAQVSQQLVNIPHGLPLENIAAASDEPFKRRLSAAMVNLNATWFASIVISIGCAVLVTLIQQSARRYLAPTLGGGTPYEHGRLRRIHFIGLRRFYVPVDRVYQSLGTSMHLSLLFYCVGLVAFIFRIDRELVSESSALGYISCCFLVYAITMVSPFFFFDCPYGTPFTVLTWRFYHFFTFGIFSIFLGIADLPHTLSTLGSRTQQVRRPSQWKKMLEERVNWHGRQLFWGKKASRAPRNLGLTGGGHRCT